MKETLRRAFVVILWCSFAVLFFTKKFGNKTAAQYSLEWSEVVPAILTICILVIPTVILHKCINWIFQKGERLVQISVTLFIG